MRIVPTALVAALVVLSGCIESPAESGTTLGVTPPNVILIVSDDAGLVDFGFQGSDSIATPRLDELAAQGVRFTSAYVTASVCSPSRAGLLTGRYQQRFGHEFNLVNRYPESVLLADWGMAVNEETVGDLMKQRGYVTGMVGKWHLGLESHFHPNERGFDEFYGFLMGGRSYFPIDGDVSGPAQMLRNREVRPEPAYLTDDLTTEAVDFLERHQGEPFFLYVSYNAPHTPMHAKAEVLDTLRGFNDEGRKKLAAMTWSLDQGVGRIVDAIDALGLGEETLIFFINDNGGAEINSSSNGAMRGHKGTKFEGGIRVPFLMRWTGAFPQGVVFDEAVSALDILPTALAAAEGRRGEGTMTTEYASTQGPLDGLNLLPAVVGSAVTTGISALSRDLFWRRGVAAAVRRGQWKLIRVEGVEPLLFNLGIDPTEATNLANQELEIRDELLEALDRWEGDMIEPVWLEEPIWSKRQIDQHR